MIKEYWLPQRGLTKNCPFVERTWVRNTREKGADVRSQVLGETFPPKRRWHWFHSLYLEGWFGFSPSIPKWDWELKNNIKPSETGQFVRLSLWGTTKTDLCLLPAFIQKELVGETSYKGGRGVLGFLALRREGRAEDTHPGLCVLLGGSPHVTGGGRWRSLLRGSCAAGGPLSLLGAGRSWGRAVRPQGSGLISDITDLGPGGKRVEVEEAYSPRIDGHHHCHQANDIDPQASFHLQDTSRRAHSPRSLWADSTRAPCPPPEPVLTGPLPPAWPWLLPLTAPGALVVPHGGHRPVEDRWTGRSWGWEMAVGIVSPFVALTYCMEAWEVRAWDASSLHVKLY